MAGYPARVRISKQSDQQPGQFDRATSLAGAEDGLFAAPNVEAVKRSEAMSSPADQSTQDDDALSDDIQDDATVYLTSSFRDWECLYLKRLAKQIHRLVCAELDRTEESLFMAYVYHDSNLDGQLRGEEALSLIEAMHDYTANAVNQNEILGEDGTITFLSLLKWYSREDGDVQETTTTMTVTSLAVGALGSGYVGSDSRIDALSWRELRANILGYRKLYNELRTFKDERRLLTARQRERDLGLEEAMTEFYNTLALQFEGDGEHLFELFNEVDESGNMLLETNEVEHLLTLLDTNASQDDLKRYIAEINLADGPLSFASLIDWWDQARNVPNSLVAEKGMALIASVKARVMSKSFGGLMSSESTAKKKWIEAAGKGALHLEALRDAYVRTLSEVREYKMERDLRAAEVDAAKL